MTEGGGLRTPSVRSTYGLLVAVGAAVLAVGLLLPFVVADPVPDDVATAGPLPDILGAEGGAGRGGGGPGPGDPGDAGVGGGEGATAGTFPGGAPVGAASGAGEADGLAGGGGTAPEARTASDVGITEDTITIGIPIPDVSSFGDVEGGASFGGVFGDPQQQWQAFVDDLNRRGGIHGRTVVPVYRLYDSIDADSMRAACIHLTEERRVFAVLGGFYGDPILCITEQHQTPLIGLASEADDFYRRSNGLYFSIGTSKDRVLDAFLRMLHADGALAGRTIGVLDIEGIDAATVDRTLLPGLARLGYRVAYHARIAADANAAQAQIPIEVQRMRAAGVDVVLPVSGLIVATVFAQEADAQRYRPRYYLSDFASGATDVYTAAMPDSFEGSIGYTAFRTGEAAAGLPEPPADAACRETYERAARRTLDPTTLAYYYTVSYCGIMRLFEQGMLAAGVNPTRAGLSAALQDLGTFQLAFGSTGSFGPGKFDAPDTVRRVTWRANCRCWLPIDEFRPVP